MSTDYHTLQTLTEDDLALLHRALDLCQSAAKEKLMRDEYASLLLKYLALKYDCQVREIKLDSGELLRDMPDEPDDQA